jgi:hypothetical protein
VSDELIGSKTALYRHEFLICPWCDKESGCRVDHLYEDNQFAAGFGPWYCHECRRGIEGRVLSPGNVEVRKSMTKSGFSRSMALLKLEGKEVTTFFVMEHDRYRSGDPTDETDEANQSHQRYFFEEHSCPTNWLRECVVVIVDKDCDPHGFLEFVRAVDVSDDFDVDDDSNWPAVFPEAFDDITIQGTIVADIKLIGAS